jgi:cyclic pyranopterin phosphate synthase
MHTPFSLTTDFRIQVVTLNCPQYPKRLLDLSDPPQRLFYVGDIGLLAQPMLAIVGARKASFAGIRLAQYFSSSLGLAGYHIISGMAYGIDSAAHQSILDLNAAPKTIAVCGNGLDRTYPPEHRELATTIFVSLGVEKIRLTGGEPLLRKNLETLISMLAKIRTPQNQMLDLTLTTNGSLLSKKAALLKEAGLQRLTVSLDALDDAVFKAMNDVDYPVRDVLDGIEAAQKAGFEGIKVNMVVKKGVNDHEILPMAKYFRNRGITLRFIEFMDVGSSNGWNLDQVLPSAEVIAKISERFPLEQLDPNYSGEVAQRWRYQDGAGEIGVISSVTQAFCHECSRARLSTDGQLFLCLFATEGFDFKTLIRSGRSDLEIANAVMQTWSNREDRYSEIRHLHTKDLERKQRKVEMSYIGG